MERWRVKYSVRTPTWWEACHVEFLDAESAQNVKNLVESRSETGRDIEVWAVTPSTKEMETHHQEWLDRCKEWVNQAKVAKADRRIMMRGQHG